MGARRCYCKSMKTKYEKLIFLIGFSVLTFFSTSLAYEERVNLPQLPNTDASISIDFKDVSLKDALKILSQQSGINFIPSEDVQDKRITVYLENVPVKNAINSIAEANSLTYEQGPDKNIFRVRPSGAVKVKTVTKVFTLNFAQAVPLQVDTTTSVSSLGATSGGPVGGYASAESMAASSSGTVAAETTGIKDIISKLLSPYGNLVADQRTNSLIISDIPEQFKLIEEMITRLDTPTPQVFIEAEIMETTLDVTDKLGLEFGGSSGSWTGTYTGTKKNFSFPFSTKSFKDHGAANTFTFGTMTLGDLAITLKALTSHADTKYLARPKLLTLNNETAIIDITSDTYVGSITSSQPQTQTNTTSAERMTTGLILKVTPQVNAADYVTMILEPSVARTEASSVNTDFLNPIKRSAKAKVMVKNGETIFIGGLLDTQKTDTKRKVPILGDVPVLGALFKSDTVTDKQTEILIFITPHIVRSDILPEAKVISEQEMAPEDISRQKMIDETVQELSNKKTQ